MRPGPGAAAGELQAPDAQVIERAVESHGEPRGVGAVDTVPTRRRPVRAKGTMATGRWSPPAAWGWERPSYGCLLAEMPRKLGMRCR